MAAVIPRPLPQGSPLVAGMIRPEQKPYMAPRPPGMPNVIPMRADFDTKGPQEKREQMLRMLMEQKVQAGKVNTPLAVRPQKTAVLVGLPANLAPPVRGAQIGDGTHPSTPQSQPMQPRVAMRMQMPVKPMARPVATEVRASVPPNVPTRTVKFELVTPAVLQFTPDGKKIRTRESEAAPKKSKPKQKKRTRKYNSDDYSD